jgi:peptide methionine sulfoxide reductase MsrA
VTELATFGAGCFWGVEVTFRNVRGVKEALVGYLGGTLANPTEDYHQRYLEKRGLASCHV